ncbi:hypothetical protein C8Q80DRAFT_1176666 [Daedaleopsis nitida]|nr:hypothetical protein C8Q80DRAFT_1176666 [Daedaleopsis nitida]
MDLDTALLQAKTLHRVLAGNAKLLQDKLDANAVCITNATTIGARMELLPEQALLMKDIIEDRMTLLNSPNHDSTTKLLVTPEILMKQAQKIQIAFDDMSRLQDCPSESETSIDLQTASDDFIFGLLQDISDVIADNISVVTRSGNGEVTPSMSGYNIATRLAKMLQSTMEAQSKENQEHKAKANESEVTELVTGEISRLQSQMQSLEEDARVASKLRVKSKSLAAELAKERSERTKMFSELKTLRGSERRLSILKTKCRILTSTVADLRARLSHIESQKQARQGDSGSCRASTQPSRDEDGPTSLVSTSRKRKERWTLWLDLSAWGLPMPPNRAREVARLPKVTVELPAGEDVLAVFSRDTLGVLLGTQRHSIFVRVGKDRHAFAKGHGITRYLLVTLEEHPWAPSQPGAHGYVVVGLGNEQDLFQSGDCRHLLVGVGCHYQYCGWYRITVTEPLTPDEWCLLPPTVKRTQLEKTRPSGYDQPYPDGLTEAELVTEFSTGTRRLPCVRLECLKFDTEFYQALSYENDQHLGRYPESTEYTLWGNPAKRRKMNNETASGSMNGLSPASTAGPSTRKVATSKSPSSPLVADGQRTASTKAKIASTVVDKDEVSDCHIDDLYAN